MIDGAPRVAAPEGPPRAAAASARPDSAAQVAPILDIQGLTKVYSNGQHALNQVNVRVLPGELTAVLGANGSGKSTLLRCAVRLIEPTYGSVFIGGRDVSRLSGGALRAARRSVAMIFQHANLVRRRSALANVATGALGRHHDLRTAFGFLPRQALLRAAEALIGVGLPHVAHQRADTLSGGQAQRVAIARGLCQEPRALLADEPVASLDPEAAEDVMRLLRDLTITGSLGVLCVLHQPDLALRYAHRVVGLRHGRLQFDAPVGEVTAAMVAELYRGLQGGGDVRETGAVRQPRHEARSPIRERAALGDIPA